MIEILSKGGILMIPILLCSVVSLAIILERGYRFLKIKTDTSSFLEPVLSDVRQGRSEQALNTLNTKHGVVARVLSAGIKDYLRYSEESLMEKAIVRAGSHELSLLERNLRGLQVIANVAPLLGLLGTVTGMIKAFMQIENYGGVVDPSQLAGGIWEAMITTATGLSIAIPSLLFYSYFLGRIDRAEASMKSAALDLLESIREKS